MDIISQKSESINSIADLARLKTELSLLDAQRTAWVLIPSMVHKSLQQTTWMS